ncbi:MAG TPA: hypothetical protein VKS78_01535 [Roseiarcus sp.]|nr:hypothetical protein [Roseiarcus sp.]
MRDFRLGTAGLLPALALVATTAVAAAQERTTASYDDWVVECQTQTGPPEQKLCDMSQISQLQNLPFPGWRYSIRKRASRSVWSSRCR